MYALEVKGIFFFPPSTPLPWLNFNPSKYAKAETQAMWAVFVLILRDMVRLNINFS